MKKCVSMFIFGILIALSMVACTEPTGISSATTITPSPSSSVAGATPSATATPATTPTPVTANIVQDYYQAIQAHNYVKAYSYVQPGAMTTDGQKLTLNMLKQLATTTESIEGPIQTFSVAAFPSEVVMTITREKLGPYHSHLILKQEGNTWKIVSIDRV